MIIVVLLLGAVYLALAKRLAPVPFMRAWFAVVLLTNILITGACTWALDQLRHFGVPRKITQMLCCYFCHFTFRCVLFWNPQSPVVVSEYNQKWSDLKGPCAVMLNHTSFYDAFTYVGMSPMKSLWNCKTLMKDSLRRIPVFGPVFDRLGHFPVYFKSDAEGNFTLDKERQQPVTDEMNRHLRDGGRLAMFPEGAVNKDPRSLQPFRYGIFQTCIDHKLPIYYCLLVGCNEC